MQENISSYLNNGYCFKDKENKEIAVLLIHGFAASPIELQPLAEYLKDSCDVYAPILPGHKTDIKDLDKQKYTTWLEFSEKIYFRLLQEYSKVVIIGFSMGGTICLYLASKKSPYKLILMSTPINFFDTNFAKILLADWKKTNISLSTIITEIKEISKNQTHQNQSNINKMKEVMNRLYKKIKRDLMKLNIEMQEYTDTYDQISYNAIHQIFLLVKFVKTQISRVDADTLIIHSKQDYLIPVSNSKEIMNSISSNAIERFLLDDSGHQVMLDKDHRIIFRKIEEFIKRKL